MHTSTTLTNNNTKWTSSNVLRWPNIEIGDNDPLKGKRVVVKRSIHKLTQFIWCACLGRIVLFEELDIAS